MPRQVVAIHGGHALEPGMDLETFIRDKVVTLDNFKPTPDWKNNLEKDLGGDYELILPRMPNPSSAKYTEWKLWFEKLVPFLRDGVVLIGHSLGGIFLAKYLSENTLPVHAAAVMLVAAPFEGMTGKHDRDNNFKLGDSLAGIESQIKNVYVYHSADDDVVPFSDFEKYKAKLPGAHAVAFTDRGHFNDASFPEIVEAIKNL